MTGAGGRVMVVTAHPDDPEFLAGGTVARLVKEGREVTYVIVTNGNKGSSVACHVSQVGDLKGVEARMRGRAATLGKPKGHMYAEGFDHVLLPG